MTEEHHENSPEETEEQLSEALQVFGGRLSRMVTERTSSRSELEERWLKDLRQYHGEYDADEKSRLDENDGSDVFVNITRNKTNAAEARLSDMLFPTDDRNWGIKPTPVPELVKLVELGGEEEQRNARAIMKEAKDRASAMEREIEDQLIETGYAAVCRDAIHDACKIGTGVIKGPVVVGRTKQTWEIMEDGTTVLQIEEDLDAGTSYVDPWNFYPSTGAAKLEDSEGSLERHYISKKKLAELARLPGYLTPQIKKVLQTDPENSQTTHDWMTDIRAINGLNEESRTGQYEMWEYNGPIDIDDLQAAGVDFEEDEFQLYFGTVLFVGPTVIRVSIHPMETQEEIYRVFCWEKDTSSVFGFGVPYLMRNPQKVMNGAWRMMLDNAGLSAGPQIVVDYDAVEPLDGDWTIRPNKVWKKKKSNLPVKDAFEIHEIRNNQSELMNIFTSARQLADEETNLPLIAQGEQAGHVTDTARGMDMLMNSSNIVLRRAVKNFDDDVTKPHIKAYYNWNMQFSDKREIKGDFQIDARGSGALLAREMQQERLMMFANLAGSNQEFALRTDWDGLYKQIAKHMQVSVDDVTLPEEEVQQKIKEMQEQEPQMPPEKQAELEFKRTQLDVSRDQFQMTFAQDREIRLTDIASRENISLAQLEQRTGVELTKEQTKRDIAAGQQNLEQVRHHLQQKNLQQGFDTF